jgi:hypothetical protein
VVDNYVYLGGIGRFREKTKARWSERERERERNRKSWRLRQIEENKRSKIKKEE